MIKKSNVLKSSKKIGKYEEVIIKKLIPFFKNQGYEVIPHARFNVSWGNILSDLDMLLIKDNKLTLVEVKSSKDQLERARKQIKKSKDFVDFIYIATDYYPRKWTFRNVGLLVVNGKVDTIKTPKIIEKKIKLESIHWLQKKCLSRMNKEQGWKNTGLNKMELSNRLIKNSNPKSLKSEIKEVVTCGLDCEYGCPIWEFNSARN